MCELPTEQRRNFWDRPAEWCVGSGLFLEPSSTTRREPCPACGKVVRVHPNGRLNAHFPSPPVPLSAGFTPD